MKRSSETSRAQEGDKAKQPRKAESTADTGEQSAENQEINDLVGLFSQSDDTLRLAAMGGPPLPSSDPAGSNAVSLSNRPRALPHQKSSLDDDFDLFSQIDSAKVPDSFDALFDSRPATGGSVKNPFNLFQALSASSAKSVPILDCLNDIFSETSLTPIADNLSNILGNYHLFFEKGDGNCFFHAVVSSLPPNTMTHDALRHLVAKKVRENPSLYGPFLPELKEEVGNPTLDDFARRTAQYAKLIQENAVWAGSIEAKLVADVLQQPVCIIVEAACSDDPEDQNQWRDMRVNVHSPHFNEQENAEREPKAPIIVWYNGTNHYDSVRPIDPESAPDPAILTQVLKVIADMEPASAPIRQDCGPR